MQFLRLAILCNTSIQEKASKEATAAANAAKAASRKKSKAKKAKAQHDEGQAQRSGAKKRKDAGGQQAKGRGGGSKKLKKGAQPEGSEPEFDGAQHGISEDEGDDEVVVNDSTELSERGSEEDGEQVQHGPTTHTTRGGRVTKPRTRGL